MKADTKFCIYTSDYRWARALRDKIKDTYPDEYTRCSIWVDVSKNPMVITIKKKNMPNDVIVGIAQLISGMEG